VDGSAGLGCRLGGFPAERPESAGREDPGWVHNIGRVADWVHACFRLNTRGMGWVAGFLWGLRYGDSA
jgi:hypothetical protein